MVHRQLLALIRQVGVEVPLVVEPSKVVELLGGGGVGASTSTWGPLLVFNPIVEFFHEL